MLDLLYHVFNYTIAGCYFTIFFLIFAGLWKEKAIGRNVLGTATSGIFLTCGLGHLTHSLTSHVYESVWGAGLQVTVDGWTTVPAITYLILRRKYGLIIRGPDMLNEFRLQVAAQATEINVMREFEKLKDEFLAMASHELRTPLTAIKGYAQVLTRSLADTGNAKAIRAVQTINRQTDVMTNLIGMLLDVSRIQSGKLEIHRQPLNLAEFVSSLISQHQLTSPQHELKLKVGEAAAWVEADPERLEQVFNNLVSNAIKYSPNARQIDLTIEAAGPDAVVLSVRDYGPGIAPHELSKIFERFYRSPEVTNSTKQGLGLGLFICKELVRANEGEISVTSVVGQGSTFVVRFPRLPTIVGAENAPVKLKLSPIPFKQ